MVKLWKILERLNVKMFKTHEEARSMFSKPLYKDHVVFNDNLVAVLNNVSSVKFDKPIYLGMCILDYSKLLMYQFYYERINKLWPRNQIIGYDTDSFFLNIETEDVYKDMKLIQDDLDTSNYAKSGSKNHSSDHFLYSTKNKKVIGKFKDELGGRIMSELVFSKKQSICLFSRK